MQTYAAEVMATPPNIGRIKVTFTEYPVLQNEFSSIRLGVQPMFGDFPGNRKFYPVVITRGEQQQFYALNSECPHAGCAVPPYNEFNGGIICPCHGSHFGIDGTYYEGPAGRSLDRYSIAFDGQETLTIEIPGLGYSVAGSIVQDGNRFRLDFPAHPFFQYEVQFRPGFGQNDSWNPVLFSLTADGPMDQSSLSITSGDPYPEPVMTSVFVDRTTPVGFYAVTNRVVDQS